MAFSIFIAVLVLQATVIRAVVGQLPAGSISIDCGLDANSSGYTEAGIFYVPDGSYVDGGQNYMVPPENINKDHRRRRPLLTVRSFPSGKRNCYALPTVAGAKYLVRVQFYYGNYDGKNLSSTLQFDLYLGVNYWDTIFASNDDEDDDDDVEEALFMAWASWVPVCLVNTNHGTPYVSSVELRPLSGELYPAITPDKSLYRYERRNMGSSTDLIAGYPDDKYDRYWWPMEEANSKWANLSTKSIIQLEPKFVVPSPVLQTAITTAANNNTLLSIISWEGERPDEFMVLLHFADFQNSQFRQFDAYLNHNLLGTPNTPYSYTPPYLAASCVSSSWFRSKDGAYNITLEGTEDSILAPMLNAFEIYGNISHKNPMTFVQDFDAIMAIKLEYGIKKNWTGDPCFPSELIWTGVKCSNASDNNATRIISLDLSNSDLHGLISNNFTLLTALEHLDLSGNHLTGSIPDSFCKSYAGTFNFSYDSERDMCNRPINLSPATNRTVIIIVSVMAPMLVMAILVISYFIWRTKRKHNSAVPEITDDRNCRKNHWDHLSKDENRQFSYEELEKFTDNFKQFIGRGGFGHVYYGCLEDNTEVAIKMRSESSSHGLHEFLAEVQSLTKVHHRNLVSLVGYCWEKDHLALVYEYMSQGNLCDHLRGKIGDAETLNWATRLRIVIDAAQGLEYLHKGCNLPIIHGDVKTNNILLGKKLNAKISDLGLSKTYHSDTQTHISATAAGSMGYIDPEYYTTGRLNESSDVYSFGVVLLEVATGEPPIIPGHGHIVQRVKQKIATGNISKVADVRLQDFYDVSSMWKVVDTAMMCTADIATQRPTMGVVVAQLKESLALEEAPGEDRDGIENLANDTALLMSPFAPLAR